MFTFHFLHLCLRSLHVIQYCPVKKNFGPKLKKDPLFSRKGADLSKNSAPRFNRVVRLNLANKIGQLRVQAKGKHFPE